jgi:enamine deaminase RidA (YjgF/YER057c/UK114 family)
MAHERFPKFNNANLYPGQGFGTDNCMVFRAGNQVFLRGQTGLDFDGELVGPGDPDAQTENAMRCAQILLEEAGSKLEDICKITVYVTDRGNLCDRSGQSGTNVRSHWQMVAGCLPGFDRIDRVRLRP